MSKYQTCAVTGLDFAESLLRKCPHPAVIQKYKNKRGNAIVSMYICKRCQFGEWSEDGVCGMKCNYPK